MFEHSIRALVQNVTTIGTYTLAYEVAGTDTETKALIGQFLLQGHQVLGRLSNTNTTKGEGTAATTYTMPSM